MDQSRPAHNRQPSDSRSESDAQPSRDSIRRSSSQSEPATAHKLVLSDLQTARLPHIAPPTRNSPYDIASQLSPGGVDRVFPVRSVVSVDPFSTPAPRTNHQDGYFHGVTHSSAPRRGHMRSSEPPLAEHPPRGASRSDGGRSTRQPQRLPPHQYDTLVADKDDVDSIDAGDGSFTKSTRTNEDPHDIGTGHVTTRFKHVVTEHGHAVVTGRAGDPLQRCEDEPIHMPGAVQGFGVLIALQDDDGKLIVRVVSENSHAIVGYSPRELFELDTFTDILSEEQADNLLDHIDFVRDEETVVEQTGPELFTLSIRQAKKRSVKCWCALHVHPRHPHLIICELELENDTVNPPVASNEMTPELPEDTIDSNPSAEEYAESTQNLSKPLRVLRSARKNRGDAAAMEVFNIMSQIQEQLAAATSLELFLKILVGVVKELTGFHRVMIYQFDKAWNGRVVTELIDPRASKDMFKGLHFPASDIPKQARDLYRVNRVRLLYDRDQETARLVCRTPEDINEPLDLTHSYLRAISPIHIKYLANMAVRASMSISINAFDELWGLISCHSYGQRGMRVSFPIRKMCRLVGDTASRNIERLSYASRLQARKLINTVPTPNNPSGYIIASSEDLLKLFNADFGLLSIQDETKILGAIEQSQEALVMLEYLKVRKITSVMTSQDIKDDFPDLIYPPGFQVLAGMLHVPLSASGADFITFFRRGQLREVKWAGNPYEKAIRQGTAQYLEPRKSFKQWSETVVGKCREWSEEEVETAAVLCLVYGKFIEVWRQKEAALQNSQLTRLLLANSAHEVRTPLNAIINYLEIALEGTLDQETRENLAKSHSASKSLIYVINDLLDLTKTEEGKELTTAEEIDYEAAFREATEAYSGDAKRKGIQYTVIQHPGLPRKVLSDHRKIRQAISNIIANAIKHTSTGTVYVETYVASTEGDVVNVEVVVQDTGSGMSSKKLEALFRDLEQIQADTKSPTRDVSTSDKEISEDGGNMLGLGLAIVARIVRNMNGQLRLKSEAGQGSRFVIQFPFELPPNSEELQGVETPSGSSIRTPMTGEASGEVLLVDRDKEARSPPPSPTRVSRKGSLESLDKKSMKSVASLASLTSHRSDVDRLIEAIQGPQMVEGTRSSQLTQQDPQGIGSRPPIVTRRTFSAGDAKEFGQAMESAAETRQETVGQQQVRFSAFPIRPIKVPEEEGMPIIEASSATAPSAILGEVIDRKEYQVEEPLSSENMSVLVAEDDPVNSRIIQKRLEKLGHHVRLTINGEECATAYDEGSSEFDVVLMDMQMPIVDGLSSTKMIRQAESTKPLNLSNRAALNGRVPIIAVSASLVEKERQTYIDAGFDAWILKPIPFSRLSELMAGIIDPKVREEALYKPGNWEKGGWFDMAEPKETTATAPSSSAEAPESHGATEVLKSRSAPQLRPPSDDEMSGYQQPTIITSKPQAESPSPMGQSSFFEPQ